MSGHVWKAGFSTTRQRLFVFNTRCLLLAFLIVLTLAGGGCGYKQELESAKQQVTRLSSEVGKLTEVAAKLEKDKQQLKEEVAALTDIKTKLVQNLDDLKKSKVAGDLENAQLKKKTTELQNELQSFKSREADLERQMDRLKKQLADAASHGPAGEDKAQDQSGVKSRVQAAPQGTQESDPCDAVIQYMKTGAKIIKEQKGEKRRELLQDLKKEYRNRMQGAPDSAKKAAEEWVGEASKVWDKPHDQSTYNLLRARNIVLEACGKKAVDLGF
ncbi:MAG: hypothetical protein QG577_2128 [Thermodesulfobacteriota bacterium]|nr:hypothetical protein [Thermodesulfobacteriota bacterium]